MTRCHSGIAYASAVNAIIVLGLLQSLCFAVIGVHSTPVIVATTTVILPCGKVIDILLRLLQALLAVIGMQNMPVIAMHSIAVILPCGKVNVILLRLLQSISFAVIGMQGMPVIIAHSCNGYCALRHG